MTEQFGTTIIIIIVCCCLQETKLLHLSLFATQVVAVFGCKALEWSEDLLICVDFYTLLTTDCKALEWSDVLHICVEFHRLTTGSPEEEVII